MDVDKFAGTGCEVNKVADLEATVLASHEQTVPAVTAFCIIFQF